MYNVHVHSTWAMYIVHSPTITVWCAILELEIWGPYLFEKNGHTITVNIDRHCQMLEDLVRPKLDEIEDIENLWLMQDGATCHTSRRSIALFFFVFFVIFFPIV